jgi:hypothetical protein
MGVEDLDRAHDIHAGRGHVGRYPNYNVLEPGPRPCELAEALDDENIGAIGHRQKPLAPLRIT